MRSKAVLLSNFYLSKSQLTRIAKLFFYVKTVGGTEKNLENKFVEKQMRISKIVFNSGKSNGIPFGKISSIYPVRTSHCKIFYIKKYLSMLSRSMPNLIKISRAVLK